jgi:hypothetical protein
VLWGSLFCIPKGFSFTALRLSTLTLSLLGILGVYALMRALCQPRWLAVITALTLGFNPIYYALSNTFMTDIPYTALTILAAVFFARSLTNGSTFHLIIATTLAIAATLSRQPAVSVPLGFALSLVLTRGFTKRNILRAAIPVVLCLGALIVFQQWLAETGRLPAEYYITAENCLHALSNPKTLVLLLAKNIFVGPLYLGLFLLPVLIFAVADIVRSHRRQVIAAFAFTTGMMVLGSGLFALRGISPAELGGRVCPITYLMPMSGNILMSSGIGPLTLPDSWRGAYYVPALPAMPVGFWLVITAMSILGAGLLITTLCVRAINLVPRLRFGKITDSELVGIFLLLSAIIYLLPLCLFGYFDRYLIPTIPLFTAGIACLSGHFPPFRLVNTRALRFSAVAVLAAFSLFAIGTTSDYLAWNRMRWEALHDLVEDNHVNVRDIDGGLEFNGFYTYDLHYQYDPRKSWWWVQGDTYRICFGAMPGYKLIREYSYRHWLPPYAGRVVVLRKSP